MTRMITRFAPSPTGFLHPGHGFSALAAYQLAQAHDGRFLLRIEDIDFTRARPEFINAIYADMAWLDIEWELPVRMQSEQMSRYDSALQTLVNRQLAYPCFCSRREIKALNPARGFDGPIYPGTCRHLTAQQRAERLAMSDRGDLPPPAWRLDLARALATTGPITWTDLAAGPQHWSGDGWGDVILARRDIGTSYHMAVTLDDADQGVTHIIRGQDLFYSTHIHRVLQHLLNLPQPLYLHHELLTDDNGQRLAKTFSSRPMRDYREQGATRADLMAMFPPFPTLSRP